MTNLPPPTAALPAVHHHHHAHCSHHDSSASGLKQRLLFVLAGLTCLLIGGGLRFFRPDQGELSALWSMAGAILGALPILRDTLAGLQSRAAENSEFYMNQFITLAVVACLASGYYFTAGIVAIILMVGHILEDRSMLGTSEAIRSLLDLSRTRARRITASEGEEEIDAELLGPGDKIRVRPGDTIPADGIVQKGRSAVNQASITGESFPVEILEGNPVFAGTVNLTGLMQIEVTKAGEDTVLGRVKEIVEEAQATRAPIVRLTEEYARYYMPVILLIAGAVLFFTHDFQRAISVIIVSIPCTFVMAGPTAMVAALASASRLGILVKSVRFFEAANEIDTVVFDKTGTLTSGQLKIVQVETYGAIDREHLLALAAALEKHSTHPIARAIVHAASDFKLLPPEPTDLREAPGLGVSGMIGEELVHVGRSSWLTENQIAVTSAHDSFPQYTAISVAVARKHAGTIYLSDTLRPETIDLKEALEAEGIDHFVMLTGDRESVAQDIASKVGFTEFQAACLPAKKQEEVEKLKRDGRFVLMVGDGVNDAPALAAGNLSMAMGALGSDVAIQTADIALMSSDLRRVAQFLLLSRRTLGIVNQNMLCGFLFIGISISLSGAGYIPPIAAAFIHEWGAFFVIFNSGRLLKFEGK
ncbi:MAG TPA: cation-translocating P-type ATPase [Candidatus Methylacidiphilales bacterium]